MQNISTIIEEIDRLSCDLYDTGKRLDAIYLAGVVRGLIAARDNEMDKLLAELREGAGGVNRESVSVRREDRMCHCS